MSSKLIFKLAVGLILASILLSACGSTVTQAPAQPTATEAPAAPASTEAPAATEAPALSGKLTVWCWKAAWEDSIVKSGALDAFLAANPGVTIDYVVTTPQDLYQKLPLALTAGTGAPDIACVESSHLAQLVDLGGLTDLTQQVQPYLDKMNAFKWTDATKDGKYYAMPWDSGPVVLYYRRDVFEAAGLPSDPESVSKAVATWEDYFKTCQTIKEKTGSECFSNNKANNYGRLYEMMLWQQGLGYYNKDGQVTVDSPVNIATLETLKKFWDANLVSDQLEWTDGWYAEMARATAAEKPVASLVEAAWMGAFLKGWIAPGTEGKWGVAQMPAMNAGQARSSNDGGSNLVIPDQSQNKAAAWALTEWLLGQTDSQVALFKASDFFPSLETTYTDPVFEEPDPFFDNQKARKAYIDAANIIPVGYVYGPNYSQMNGYVATAIQKVATGAMSPTDALKEAADAIRAQTGMP